MPTPPKTHMDPEPCDEQSIYTHNPYCKHTHTHAHKL